MAHVILKKGEYVDSGPFSRVDYTNLMEYLTMTNLLKSEEENPVLLESISDQNGRIQEKRIDYLKNDVKVIYFSRAPGNKKSVTSCSLIGPEEHIEDAKKIMLKTMSGIHNED